MCRARAHSESRALPWRRRPLAQGRARAANGETGPLAESDTTVLLRAGAGTTRRFMFASPGGRVDCRCQRHRDRPAGVAPRHRRRARVPSKRRRRPGSGPSVVPAGPGVTVPGGSSRRPAAAGKALTQSHSPRRKRPWRSLQRWHWQPDSEA